jgi:hypothetical protein
MAVAAWPAPKVSYGLSGALEEAGDPVLLPQRLHPRVAPREELVRIALMADVPHELVVGSLEDVVQGDRQLHDAEAGPDVATRARADVHHARANVVGERAQLVAGQGPKVGRGSDAVEE